MREFPLVCKLGADIILSLLRFVFMIQALWNGKQPRK